MNIYKIFFDKGLEWRELDYFLHKRMSDLAAIRNHLIVDSYLSEYEKNYILPKWNAPPGRSSVRRGVLKALK